MFMKVDLMLRSSLQKVDTMFQPREGGPAIEEADGHDDEAQPVAVEEGLKDEKSSDDFPEEEVKPPMLEEELRVPEVKLLRSSIEAFFTTPLGL